MLTQTKLSIWLVFLLYSMNPRVMRHMYCPVLVRNLGSKKNWFRYPSVVCLLSLHGFRRQIRRFQGGKAVLPILYYNYNIGKVVCNWPNQSTGVRIKQSFRHGSISGSDLEPFFLYLRFLNSAILKGKLCFRDFAASAAKREDTADFETLSRQ